MKKYNYIKIVHEGEDYLGIKYNGEYVEVEGWNAIKIIKALLNKINK